MSDQREIVHLTPQDEENYQARAWAMFHMGKSVEEVEAELKIRHLTALKYQRSYLAQEETKKLQELYVSEKAKLLPQVLSCGLNLIYNAFKHREESGDPLNLHETKIVSEVIGNLDKIIRLDAGKATEIVDVQKTIPSTFADILKALKKDPFIDVTILKKEIDYSVTQEKKDEGKTKTN